MLMTYVKHHQLFRTPSSSSNRLRDLISLADATGLALLMHECLDSRLQPCLPFVGFGCRPFWLQLSYPCSAAAAISPNLMTYKMRSTSSFTAPIHTWSLSTGLMRLCFIPQVSTMCVFVGQKHFCFNSSLCTYCF